MAEKRMTKEKILSELKAKLAEEILSITEEYKKAYTFHGSEEELEFASSVNTFLTAAGMRDGTDAFKAFVKLMEKAINQKYVRVPTVWTFMPGVMVVPLSTGGSQNYHNYPLQRPFMMAKRIGSHPVGIRMDGTYGNHFLTGYNDLRPATAEEIELFVRNLSPNGLWEVAGLIIKGPTRAGEDDN